MSRLYLIGFAVFALIALGAVIYWQLVIAEGAHLGQRVVTTLYDLTAGRYDAIKKFDTEIEARYLGRPIVSALRDQPAALVLDIATGTARLPLALLEQPGFQGKIIGVDDSLRMLTVAASKTRGYHARLRLIWVDAVALPFPDHSFDTVTCLEMLEFTPSPARQLREACRVLRPGGLLITTRRRGVDAMLMPGKTHSRVEFLKLLTGLGMTDVRIEVWQMDYDLVWAMKPGRASGGAHPLIEFLRCPSCRKVSFAETSDQVTCEECGATYRIVDGIIRLNRGGE